MSNSMQLVEAGGDDANKQIMVLPENRDLQHIEGHGYGRRVTVQKEAVFIKHVKVPVTLKKVEPCTFKKRIKTHKLVEVDDFEEVEEQYTEMVEVEATREKKIWVQESHWEDFTRKVPVSKTRVVKKPYTLIKQVDEFQMVTVPGTKVEQIPGFRIDTVEERKLVEVEEWEMYTMKPHTTGQKQKGTRTEISVETSRTIRTGTQLIADDEESRRNLLLRGVNLDEIEYDDTYDDNISTLPLFNSESTHASGMKVIADEEEEEKRRR